MFDDCKFHRCEIKDNEFFDLQVRPLARYVIRTASYYVIGYMMSQRFQWLFSVVLNRFWF
jgi:hypothetical protein